MTAPSDLLGKFKDARLLVVGDVMLDRFVYGRVRRISPEAPVPVLLVEREAESLGGAGNVARNIASLGGRATLIGARGRDEAGVRLDELLSKDARLQGGLLIFDNGRTTLKVRYIADQQQVMRADYEKTWRERDGARILDHVRQMMDGHDALVISDYAKGFLSPNLVKDLIALFRAQGKPVVVDPKGVDLAPYDGATVITPNKHEAARATGGEAESELGASACAQSLLARLPGLSAVVVTRGAAGLSLLVRGDEIRHVAARAREVFDVSGAGDTVVAALALTLASGGDLVTAATLANMAAGIAVTMVGTAAVTANELASEFYSQQLESAERKIVSADRAGEWLKRWRAKGQRVGFTNGCFDLIHPGHISLLRQARAKCDRLVVGLNSDASVRRLKGSGRPVQDEMARALVLASLAMVDLVVIFTEDTPEQLIAALRPDVLIKGADYSREDIVGADFVTSYGGEVVRAELVPEYSTSSLIKRARE